MTMVGDCRLLTSSFESLLIPEESLLSLSRAHIVGVDSNKVHMGYVPRNVQPNKMSRGKNKVDMPLRVMNEYVRKWSWGAGLI